MLERIRFRHAGHVLAPPARQLERVARDPVDAGAREDLRLDCYLAVDASVHPAAGTRVLSFRVLSHADEVDPAVLEVAQRTANPGKQADRPQVDEELELLPNPQLDAPGADMVGDAGSADRPEVDRVELAQDLEGILGHHPPGALVVVASPGELLEVEPEGAVESRGPRKHAHADRDHLAADPVSGDDRNPVCSHGAPGGER